ncbi:hypothetical protein DICPUDRAFT_91691 [Dictyostelium purpureum]|uniref:Uncharacterized protein n=1 Tax=Dictyostelium purpureum TaxID=5786 RepID=F0ZG13_DICPU|nr:uncharacterized protein DICPUDRAFT_91691 [Dictyostelium purpureum]EGC37138.1 hypothetical protein DICPUDRAFT_91691 [Dictyostelium purpureum]|eukprot:XP_003286341.1 hypothetical protein DICPUDRAFT_91691 [Dictyostelium purpureum]
MAIAIFIYYRQNKNPTPSPKDTQKYIYCFINLYLYCFIQSILIYQVPNQPLYLFVIFIEYLKDNNLYQYKENINSLVYNLNIFKSNRINFKTLKENINFNNLKLFTYNKYLLIYSDIIFPIIFYKLLNYYFAIYFGFLFLIIKNIDLIKYINNLNKVKNF